MRYICKRCAYGTNIKCNLINHLTRKKPCIATCLDISRDTLIEQLLDKSINVNPFVNPFVNPSVNNDNICKPNVCSPPHEKKIYTCKYCNLGFTTRQAKSRHQLNKSCQIKKNAETSLEKEEIALMKQIIAQDKEEKELLRKQIELLMMAQKGRNTNIETQNNIGTQNNTTNIQINGWGHEDTSHLTDKFLRFCYDRPFTSIQRVIEAVFFNPNCPKNWNTMIKDDKSSKALIYDAEKKTWLKKETNGVVDDLMHTGYGILDANFDKQKDANKLTDRIIEKFTNFQDIYAKSDKQYEKRLATEIKELLINYKAYHIIPDNDN